MSNVIQKLPTTALECSLIAAQYRSSPLYGRFQELNATISMLHPDVLAMLYHYGLNSRAPVLELGSYVGGSTIALALGLCAQEDPPKLVAVEMGGSNPHPTHGTSDIITSLRSNLSNYRVGNLVTLVIGHSRSPNIVQEVRASLDGDAIGFLAVDTDGQIGEDLLAYRDLLGPRAYLVVDDYYSPGAPEKQEITRDQVDELETKGLIESFGVFGWGTWFGRLK